MSSYYSLHYVHVTATYPGIVATSSLESRSPLELSAGAGCTNNYATSCANNYATSFTKNALTTMLLVALISAPTTMLLVALESAQQLCY